MSLASSYNANHYEQAPRSANGDTFSEAQIQGMLGWLSTQPEQVQTAVLEAKIYGGLNDQDVAAMINACQLAERQEQQQASLNQQSVNNEASLMMGGYDPGVANAVSASMGVGVDQAYVQQAAADFAREAARAIQNGQTLEQVRTADPNLSLVAQQAIYEQAAIAQGTTSAEVEQRAEAQKQADMAAVQNAVFGGASVAAAANANPFASLLAANNFQAPDALVQANSSAVGAATVTALLPNQAQRDNEQGWVLGA